VPGGYRTIQFSRGYQERRIVCNLNARCPFSEQLRREVQTLPNKGISADGAHLGYPASGFCDFTGAQETYHAPLSQRICYTALSPCHFMIKG